MLEEGGWSVEKAVMSRSARRLMEGWVRVPDVLWNEATGDKSETLRSE
nr:PrpF domain-containing protein [Pseudomonas congelans]